VSAKRCLEQLELRLFEDEPWQGRMPRGLTKGSKVLYYSQEAEKDACDGVDPFQYDLFGEAVKELPRISGGAPTLLPLPSRSRGGGQAVKRSTLLLASLEDYDG